MRKIKTERKIFTAFALNLVFSLIELVGGLLTGSIAIISDAMHDFGDAMSIGLSFVFENKSKRNADERYSYGYARFSVLGGLITTLILLLGSFVVIYNAVLRLLNPVSVKSNGMLILAIIGLLVNALATYFTHGGKSINQRAVNLHMLEDLLGWLVILVGAIVIRLTGFYMLDPILSILVALFILGNSLKNTKEIADIFLMKTPQSVDLSTLKSRIAEVDGVSKVSFVRVLTTDGQTVFGSLGVVAENDYEIKKKIKEIAKELGVDYPSVEILSPDETEDAPAVVGHKCGCRHHHH